MSKLHLVLCLDLLPQPKQPQLQKRSKHCSPSLAIFKSVLLLLHMLQLVDSLDSPAQPKRRSSIIQSALHFTSSMEQQKRVHLLQRKELQLLVWMSMAIWSREQPSRTRVQVRSSDSPAPPKRELSFLADSETSSPLLAMVQRARPMSRLVLVHFLDLLVEQRAHPTPKSSLLSSASLEHQLSNSLVPMSRLDRSELVSATQEFLETSPEVSQSSDSEPSQKVRRSDLLEQKQNPLPQHHISLKVSSISRRELRILSPHILNLENLNPLEL